MSSTNRGKVREVLDTYITPPWLTAAILPTLQERLQRIGVWPAPRVFEPACGSQRALAKVIEDAWQLSVDCSDIIPPWNNDFLELAPIPEYDLIITNPPYVLAHDFFERAKLWRKSEKSLVVMLLRLNFLGSQKRAAWLRANTPAVAVTPKRPCFAPNQHGRLSTDSIEYAWFILPGEAPQLMILETEKLGKKMNKIKKMNKTVDVPSANVVTSFSTFGET